MGNAKAGPGQCTYDLWYIGDCCKPAVGPDGFCQEHTGLECTYCFRPATHGDTEYHVPKCDDPECTNRMVREEFDNQPWNERGAPEIVFVRVEGPGMRAGLIMQHGRVTRTAQSLSWLGGFGRWKAREAMRERGLSATIVPTKSPPYEWDLEAGEPDRTSTGDSTGAEPKA